VVTLWPCFRGGVWESDVLLEQMQLNFRFRNKFIILLPCGLLVDKNIFKKGAFLKVLLATLIMAVMS
jgi:hypothetical protein